MKKFLVLLGTIIGGCIALTAADVTVTQSNSPYTLTGNIDTLTFDNTGGYTSGEAKMITNSPAAAAVFTIAGNVTGTGTIVRQAGETSNDRSSWLQLGGDNSGFSGNVNVSGNSWVAFTKLTAGSADAAWNLSMKDDTCGLLFQSTGDGTLKLGDLSGNGMVRGGNGSGNINLEIGALGKNSTFSGIIKNDSQWNNFTVSVTKVGSGEWTLSGKHTFTGGLTVKEGTLKMENGASLAATNVVTVAGGRLVLGNTVNLVATNAVSITSGTLEITNAANIPSSQAIPLAAGATLAVKSTGGLTLSNAISGAGTLEVLNGNNFLLRGANSGFSGTLKLTGGTTSVDKVPGQTGTSKIQFNGGTLRTYGGYSNAIEVTEKGGIWHVVSSGSTLTGNVSGTGTLTVRRENGAGGKLILNGDASGLTGGFNVESGVLRINASAKLAANVGIKLSSTATLEFQRSEVIWDDFYANLDAAAGSLLYNDSDANSRVTLRGKVAGDVTLAKGWFAFGADNVSNLKSITLNSGASLCNWGANRLGTAKIQMNGGVLAPQQTATYANDLSVLANGGTIQVASDVSTPSEWTLTLSGKISGTNASAVLNKTDVGTLELTGTNDYQGKWKVSGGTLALNVEDAIATSSEVMNNAAITFSKNQTLNNLSGTGSIVGTDGAVLTLNNTTNTTFTGTVNVASMVFKDSGDSTSKLTLTQGITGLQNLDLMINANQDAADNLTLPTFDPNVSNLSVTMALLDGEEYNPGMIFPVLTVTEGTLPLNFDWQSVLALANRGDWNLYLSADQKSLVAGVNGAKYPEPGAFWLLLLGGLWVLRRRS